MDLVLTLAMTSLRMILMLVCLNDCPAPCFREVLNGGSIRDVLLTSIICVSASLTVWNRFPSACDVSLWTRLVTLMLAGLVFMMMNASRCLCLVGLVATLVCLNV